MSNVKRMDIWTVVRTILERNPGIRAKELIEKVQNKTRLSRSTVYEHLSSFSLRGKIHREKGRYYLPEQFEIFTQARLRLAGKRVVSKADREISLSHSKSLFLSVDISHRYDSMDPQVFLDQLVFQDRDDIGVVMVEDRCVLQHLKSGYYKEVYRFIEKYRRLMDETGLSKASGLPELRVSETPRPKRGPYPRLMDNRPRARVADENLPSLTEYLNSKEVDPEVSKRYGIPSQVPKQKIKEIISLRNLLIGQINRIVYDVSHGVPLKGHCDCCPNR